MSAQTIGQLHAAAKAKGEELVELLDKLDNEKSPTAEQLTSWNETRLGLQGEMKSLNDQIERMEARGEAMGAIRRANQPFEPMRHSGAPGGSAKSLGEAFHESAAFKTWFTGVAGDGPSASMPEPSGGRLPASGPMQVPGSLKSLLYGTTNWATPAGTSANALVQPEHRGLVDMGTWMRPLVLVDLISRETTQSDVIYFARSTGATSAAAPTAEATATGGSSGAKPEGGLTFDLDQTNVRTIPVWVPATRQALADAGQLRGIIDEYLRYEVARALEVQVISGAGTGQNFLGIESLTNKLSQAYSTDRLTTARKARTNLLLNGRVVPTAWAMYPSDWEAFDLEVDNEQRYYFGGPRQMGQATLWGIPVIESESVTVGAPILGAWNYARLADREATTIRVSDSHSDFFARNLIAILAEMRAAFYVTRHEAFCIVDIVA